MYHAAESGHTAVVKLLLDRGVNKEAKAQVRRARRGAVQRRAEVPCWCDWGTERVHAAVYCVKGRPGERRAAALGARRR